MSDPTPLEYATGAHGMYEMVLKDGTSLDVEFIDGGGISMDEGAHYEVHGEYADGTYLCVEQRLIARVVVKATGQEVEFGNPFFEGHPRPKDLDEWTSGEDD